MTISGPGQVIVLVVPALAAALGLVMTRTRFGRAVAASADNPDLARLSGISPKRASTIVWSISGLLGTISLVLVAGRVGNVTQVATLGLASQVDGLVAVDADGEALHPAIIWLDRRASEQVHAFDGLDEPAVRRVTGLNVDASHVAPKILWLRDAHPDVYERAAGLLLPGSALVAWLTGEHVLDHANASSTLLYDVSARAWSPEMLAATGLDAARLGTICAAAEIGGPLRPSAAAAIGLTPSTKVVVGTGDEHGASLGAGGIRAGIVVDISGTAEPVAVAAGDAVIDETGLVETHAHADPRVWLVENPGFVSLAKPMSAIQGILERGGFSRGADMTRVTIISHVDGKSVVRELNLRRDDKDAAPVLESLVPDDVVFVPKTGIAAANAWVEQWIDGLTPQMFKSVRFPSL